MPISESPTQRRSRAMGCAIGATNGHRSPPLRPTRAAGGPARETSADPAATRENSQNIEPASRRLAESPLRQRRWFAAHVAGYACADSAPVCAAHGPGSAAPTYPEMSRSRSADGSGQLCAAGLPHRRACSVGRGFGVVYSTRRQKAPGTHRWPSRWRPRSNTAPPSASCASARRSSGPARRTAPAVYAARNDSDDRFYIAMEYLPA